MEPLQNAVWQSFTRISEDLALLEDQFQTDQHAMLKAQVAAMDVSDVAQPAAPEGEQADALAMDDDAFLNTLADALAERLKPIWTDSAVIGTFLKLNELRQDNETMAAELDAMAKSHAAVSLENRLLKEQLAQFSHLMGAFYFKK